MRKLLSVMLMLIMFVACSDDKDEEKNLVLDKGTSTEQTIYSDETSTKEGITFTATENWVATVNDISTRAAGKADWIELSQYSGGPGKFTLSISIEKNNTGSDRKAEIKIVSGETSITIVVEQKAVTSEESGNEPEKPQGIKKVKDIKMYKEYDNSTSGSKDMLLYSHYEISYDAEGRIETLLYTDMENITEPNGTVTSKAHKERVPFVYKKQGNGNMMIEIFPVSNEGTPDQYYSDKEYLYCDNTGKIVSAKYVTTDMGGEEREYTYVYNEKNQLTRTIGEDNIFTWNDGNIISYKTTAPRYDGMCGTITYSDVKNNASIDLAYAVCFFNSIELLAFPHAVERGTFTGCFGERCANMPSKIVTNTENPSIFEYEYKLNGEGYISEINETETLNYTPEKYVSKYKVVIEYM